LADHPDRVLLDLTVGVGKFREVVVAHTHALHESVVDHVDQVSRLVDEIEVLLLPLVREGEFGEVLLVVLVISENSVNLFQCRWFE